VRCFGSKVHPDNPPGEIVIQNVQTSLESIDVDRLRHTIHDIRRILGYPTYDISLLLTNDDDMQSTNEESRGVNAPTDILSFPFHEAVAPGTLEEPQFDVDDYYNLGDLLIDVPYVMRQCEEDQAMAAESENDEESSSSDEEEDDDDEEEEDERGVSGAMATVYDPEERINMLLVHGMLHLVGYDHEYEDDYELMVSREEEILKELGLPRTKQ
jgi:probable rRNA maturation factor